MAGKNIVITGTTEGIGKASARILAKRGHRVIMLNRNPEKSAVLVSQMREDFPEAKVFGIECDLSKNDSIVKAAGAVVEYCDKIDVLINNAATFTSSRKENEEGLELQWAVNQIGPFRLTEYLIEILRNTEGARIVNVASTAHSWYNLNFNDIQLRKNYHPMKAYSRSKLANIMWTYALSERESKNGISVNCLHPGGVATHLGDQDSSWLHRLLWTLGKPFMMSSEKGAKTSVYLALSDEVEGISGKYFAKCREVKSSPQSMDRELQQKLMEHCREYL